ncbi:MAG: beta-N-acetylhexosaminidase [Burkholderiales bacterium]|uniref:beta-N-acetylhexosaminidase n=1 Tax=Nitrosomonas sp. TaxID=42353 RepID=UPI001DC10048|nr:beta-N-acetylhexosaminidase [Nitrosomonas sp.]MCB1949216.1 beta-N-acetylhexosaminidase [Nitrosomonas sp.]MCP5242219.1 beta-N-acetylhexosaminidase [Burkholderiales bacterium]
MSLGPVMLDIAATELTDEDKQRLLHPLTGGVILFSRNYTSQKQLTTLIQDIRELRTPHLLIAVDQEGGRVQRFKDDFTRLPAMRELGKVWDQNPARARHLSKQVGFVLASELVVCNVDLSFTPVLDIDHGQSSVIGDRAFHRDIHAVSDLAYALMMGLKAGGMQAVGKHFPGHGGIQADSHFEKSVDQRRYADIEMDDMVPFQRMIDFGLAGIMAAHVIYPQVDQYPAGFSRKWLQDILRQQLLFEGCIFSDDLSMQGAAYFSAIGARAKAALEAGCDMILVCNDPQAADELLETLQWNISATSLARLARMHGKKRFASMMKLREDAAYVRAVREVGAIGDPNELLPF